TRGHLIGARPWRWLGAPTGRDQDRVVYKLLAAVGVHDLLAEVDLGRPGLEMDVDVLLGGLLCGTHEDLLAADLAAQVAGQGHPVVERVLFRGDDRDR